MGRISGESTVFYGGAILNFFVPYNPLRFNHINQEMKDKLKPFGILILLIAGMLSCEKNKEEIKFYWQETGCSNPWNENADDTAAETIEHVKEYLEENKIEVKDVSVEYDPDAVEYCEACDCKTGNKIIMTVLKKDEKKMEKLNFTSD